MIDIVYIFQHSKNDDFELKHSLRSVAKNCPWVRKIWVYGDKPDFLSDDATLIEHVPGGKGAMFKLLYEASLIPGLSDEFYMFADDYIVLQPFVPDTAYYLENMDALYQDKTFYATAWMVQLYKTWQFLKKEGIAPRLNYEAHVPTYFKKQWIQEAYKPTHTGDKPLEGLMGITYILNRAKHKYNIPIACVANDRCSFIGREPKEVNPKHATFMFYDNAGLGGVLKRFIENTFPKSCKYEKVNN